MAATPNVLLDQAEAAWSLACGQRPPAGDGNGRLPGGSSQLVITAYAHVLKRFGAGNAHLLLGDWLFYLTDAEAGRARLLPALTPGFQVPAYPKHDAFVQGVVRAVREKAERAAAGMLADDPPLVRQPVVLMTDTGPAGMGSYMLVAWRRDFVQEAARVLGCGAEDVPVKMHARLRGCRLYAAERELYAWTAHKALECGRCGTRSASLRMCARCTTTWYCGRECQVAHWSAAVEPHKELCKVFA